MAATGCEKACWPSPLLVVYNIHNWPRLMRWRTAITTSHRHVHHPHIRERDSLLQTWWWIYLRVSVWLIDRRRRMHLRFVFVALIIVNFYSDRSAQVPLESHLLWLSLLLFNQEETIPAPYIWGFFIKLAATSSFLFCFIPERLTSATVADLAR